MSSNQIVLQLAKFNDNSSINTASWSNHINEALTLNEGDEIIVTKAFLDTRNLSSSNIFIAEDINLELEIYFYWVNDSNPGSTQTDLEHLNHLRNTMETPVLLMCGAVRDYFKIKFLLLIQQSHPFLFHQVLMKILNTLLFNTPF